MSRIRADIVQVHPFRVAANRIECLVLRRSPNEPDYPGIWQVITGMIGPEESAAEAAFRETVEETGVRPLRLVPFEEVSSYYLADRDQIVLSPTFACELGGDEAVVLCEEHDMYEWLGVEQAVERLAFRSHRAGTVLLDGWWKAQRNATSPGND